MELTLEQADNGYLISQVNPGELTINGTTYREPLILAGRSIITPWPVTAETALFEQHLNPLLALNPELVILGLGDKFNYPAPQQLKVFYDLKIGFEIMTTVAACRTYNITLTEGRNVVAGIIV